MERLVRGLLISAFAAVALTAAHASQLSHVRSVGRVLWFVCAPALLTSIASFQWIQRLHAISPNLYSAALTHFRFISSAVFFIIAWVWLGGLFSPLLFGVRVFGFSRGGTQAVVLGAAVVVTLICFYLVLASFPHPE